MTETKTDQGRNGWYDPAWPYRRKIVIDHRQIAGRDQEDFPALVAVTDPALKTKAHGGHVGLAGGEDFIFVLADGLTRLEHEVTRYNAAAGELTAWVKAPYLSAAVDTVFYLYYGHAASPTPRPSEPVWDDGYALVLHLPQAGRICLDSTRRRHEGVAGQVESPAGQPEISFSAGVKVAGAITVEAWVETQASRPEALQALVSQWGLLRTLDTFTAYDAGQTDGLKTIGFFGAVFDGRYVYFAPAYDGVDNHGRVLRYDTQGPFEDRASWSAYDAGATSGLSAKGYYGGVFDGRYVYFVPRLDKNFTPEVAHHSRVLRYDTRGDFKEARSWRAFDAGDRVSHQGAGFDGRYIYFCPGYEHLAQAPAPGDATYQWQDVVPSGKVLRYDTRGDFADRRSYTTYDASQTSGLDTRCYDGAVFDGRYIYFVPLESRGVVLRYDTRAEFTQPESWTAYNARRTSGLEMGWSVGAIFDGRYVYLVPYSNGVVVRYDSRGDFDDSASWLAYDAGRTSGLETIGYDGAVFDGRYIYFIPFHQGQDSARGFHARVLRYDTQQDFTAPGAWQAHDAAGAAGLNPVGFNGGAFDGRYIYFAPWRDGLKPDGLPAAHGRILRYDTTGAGASFSLRYTDYGHNGGLCGAAPGPSFLLNTGQAVLGVQAHASLPPGRRHLAGVYDGSKVALVIDGVLVAERSGAGAIQMNDTPLVIGRIQDGLGRFDGLISEVRISSVARSIDWLKTAYNNLSSPATFCHIGVEEHSIEGDK